eukprot:sb/3476715/
MLVQSDPDLPGPDLPEPRVRIFCYFRCFVSVLLWLPWLSWLPCGYQESSLGSSKDQWKQDIWELRGIKGSRAQGESIGDIGTWCDPHICVGIALGGYVAKGINSQHRPANRNTT